MAGIGFELKKLFIESKNEPFGNIKAILFSSAISIGPWLITATSLNLLILISKSVRLGISEQTLFMSTVF